MQGDNEDREMPEIPLGFTGRIFSALLDMLLAVQMEVILLTDLLLQRGVFNVKDLERGVAPSQQQAEKILVECLRHEGLDEIADWLAELGMGTPRIPPAFWDAFKNDQPKGGEDA